MIAQRHRSRWFSLSEPQHQAPHAIFLVVHTFEPSVKRQMLAGRRYLAMVGVEEGGLSIVHESYLISNLLAYCEDGGCAFCADFDGITSCRLGIDYALPDTISQFCWDREKATFANIELSVGRGGVRSISVVQSKLL